MGIESVLKIGEKALTQVAKKAYVKPMCEVRTLESLGPKMEQLTDDVVQIQKNCRVNPIQKNIVTGEIIALPRFNTPEMRVARRMNQEALKQIKKAKSLQYSKATAEDLQRLIDTSIEASSRRTFYTNINTGINYNLLLEETTEDGLRVLKVLGEDGQFIKKVKIKPKKIIIIDDFTNKKAEFAGIPLSHGQEVEIFMRRFNPFSDIECVDVGKVPDPVYTEDILNAVGPYINKADYISISMGGEHIINFENINKIKKFKLESDIIRLPEIKTRIFFSAGNKGSQYLNEYLVIPNVEGVGSLSKKGAVSDFSASRNSMFTQHYELGEYQCTATDYGFSFFDGKSTELPLTHSLSNYHKYHNKVPNIATHEDLIQIESLIKARASLEVYLNENCKKMSSEKVENLKKKICEIEYQIQNQIRKFDDQCKVIKEGEIYRSVGNKYGHDFDCEFILDKNGHLLHRNAKELNGTSLATPIRVAKISLQESLNGLL